jgi:hypothetical protein
MKIRYNIVSIYDRLFDTPAALLRPNVCASTGKNHFYCELSGGSAKDIEEMFQQRLRGDLLVVTVRNGRTDSDPYPRQGRSTSTTVDDGRSRPKSD